MRRHSPQVQPSRRPGGYGCRRDGCDRVSRAGPLGGNSSWTQRFLPPAFAEYISMSALCSMASIDAGGVVKVTAPMVKATGAGSDAAAWASSSHSRSSTD